jgi:hypothetical protein
MRSLIATLLSRELCIGNCVRLRGGVESHATCTVVSP